MDDESSLGIKTYGSQEEGHFRSELLGLLTASPIPDDQLLSNLGLYIDSKHLSRILFMDNLFRQIVEVQGVVMEFGTRWGQNLALMSALRGIHDPYNRHRKIIGFDTFSGFPSTHQADGESDMISEGNLSVTEGYADYLERILDAHENLNPLSHIKKFELRVGDGSLEIDRYLKDHPETIVALAYFDFDLYEPTKNCIEAISDRLVKGSVVGFDELNDPDSPGETIAVMETFGLRNIRLRRPSFASRVSYFIVE